jgi:hypothetical protein
VEHPTHNKSCTTEIEAQRSLFGRPAEKVKSAWPTCPEIGFWNNTKEMHRWQNRFRNNAPSKTDGETKAALKSKPTGKELEDAAKEICCPSSCRGWPSFCT